MINLAALRTLVPLAALLVPAAVAGQTVIAGDTAKALPKGDTTGTGTLTVTPVQDFETSPVGPVVGLAATLTITPQGVWTYSVLSSHYPPLAEDDTATTTFTVRTADATEAQVVITVIGVNDAPNAVNAPTFLGVNEGDTVTLGGRAYDLDTDAVLTYQWEQTSGPTVTLNNANTDTTTFIAPDVSAPSVFLRFQLTATDEHGASLTGRTTTVVVRNVPTPAIIGGEMTGTLPGGSTMINGMLTITDPDADEERFQTGVFHQTYGHLRIKADGSWTYRLENPTNAAYNALAADATGTDTFTVASWDGTEATITITVTGINDPPSADAGSRQEVEEGDTVTLSGTDSTDPDTGETLSYLWERTAGPTVALANANTATATFTAPELTSNGTLSFRLTVTDAAGLSDTDDTDVAVDADDDPTVITGNTEGTVTADTTMNTITGTLIAADPEGRNTFRTTGVTKSAGAYGVFSITTAGVWTYTLDRRITAYIALPAGETEDHVFTVQSADRTEADVTITVTGVNDPPRVNVSTHYIRVNEGELVTLPGSGIDDDDDAVLTYEWEQISGKSHGHARGRRLGGCHLHRAAGARYRDAPIPTDGHRRAHGEHRTEPSRGCGCREHSDTGDHRRDVVGHGDRGHHGHRNVDHHRSGRE